MDKKQQVRLLRIIGLIEGISFLLIIFVTMPLKYLLEMPQPNQVIGMGHGILFILYVVAVLAVALSFKWKWVTTFLALAASIVPFGTFVADSKIFKKYL